MFELVLKTPKVENSPKWIFKRNEIFIGSSIENDFCLNVNEVNDREFHIYLYKSGLWIKRYKGKGILIVDGINIDEGECKKINNDCTITYLKHIFSIKFFNNSHNSFKKRINYILELNLNNKSKRISLHDSGTINIGRGVNNHISFEYNLLSKNHLQINNYQGDLWVQDLNSKNGSLLNGKKLLKPERYDSNSIIKIGDLIIKIISKQENM